MGMLGRLVHWIASLLRQAGCDEEDWDPYWDYGDWRTGDDKRKYHE